MIRGGAGEDGFTLIELLVSLAVTAAAAGLLTATLHAARVSREHGEAAAAASDGVAAAQGLVRGRIVELVEDDQPAGGTTTGSTTGSPDTFSFIAPPMAARPPSGLQRYTLSLTPDGIVAFKLGDRADGGIRGRLPVVGGVRGLDLAYFGATPDDPVARWRPTWIGQANPPELVRIRLRFAMTDPRVWPDLVIAPAATVSIACHVDPNSGACA